MQELKNHMTSVTVRGKFKSENRRQSYPLSSDTETIFFPCLTDTFEMRLYLQQVNTSFLQEVGEDLA